MDEHDKRHDSESAKSQIIESERGIRSCHIVYHEAIKRDDLRWQLSDQLLVIEYCLDEVRPTKLN